MDRLVNFTPEQWEEMFSFIKQLAQEEVEKKRGRLEYRYLGECDDPEEMLPEFVPKSLVENVGKTNWFVRSDGSFFTCGDATCDNILDSRSSTDCLFPFEEYRNSIYEDLSMNDRIAFRINLQGATETEAKEIVCYELGIPAYENSYLFEIVYKTINSVTNESDTRSYQECIEADTEEKAYSKVKKIIPSVGDVTQTGVLYDKGSNVSTSDMILGRGGTKYSDTVTDINVNLISVKVNEGY